MFIQNHKFNLDLASIVGFSVHQIGEAEGHISLSLPVIKGGFLEDYVWESAKNLNVYYSYKLECKVRTSLFCLLYARNTLEVGADAASDEYGS